MELDLEAVRDLDEELKDTKEGMAMRVFRQVHTPLLLDVGASSTEDLAVKESLKCDKKGVSAASIDITLSGTAGGSSSGPAVAPPPPPSAPPLSLFPASPRHSRRGRDVPIPFQPLLHFHQELAEIQEEGKTIKEGVSRFNASGCGPRGIT